MSVEGKEKREMMGDEPNDLREEVYWLRKERGHFQSILENKARDYEILCQQYEHVIKNMETIMAYRPAPHLVIIDKP